MTRRRRAGLVFLAFGTRGSCGGQEPKGQDGPTAKTPRAALVTEAPGRLVGIGGGRSLYLECVGSGSPTVVLEAGFGADTFSWRDVQPQVGASTRACAYDRAGAGNSVGRRACATHATRSPTFGGCEANGALAQVAAGTRNLPTAQAALLTPIHDERDPTTPTRRPCNPLPQEKSHIA